MILTPTFSASVVCMDPTNIYKDTKELYDLGHRYLHIDAMDGHYVPRLGIFPEISRRLSEQFPDMKQDCHLMVSDPEFVIDEFKDIDAITTFVFHIDGNEKNAARIIDKIRDYGKQAGIAINLGSSFSSVCKLVKYMDVDFVLFMGIHPGVLKQVSKPKMLSSSIRDFKNVLLENGINKDITIQVDGAVSFESIPDLIDAGANFLVGGTSTIYKKGDTVANNSARIKGFMNV
jgi:ribulose-phosphate 3-epimerase